MLTLIHTQNGHGNLLHLISHRRHRRWSDAYRCRDDILYGMIHSRFELLGQQRTTIHHARVQNWWSAGPKWSPEVAQVSLLSYVNFSSSKVHIVESVNQWRSTPVAPWKWMRNSSHSNEALLRTPTAIRFALDTAHWPNATDERFMTHSLKSFVFAPAGCWLLQHSTPSCCCVDNYVRNVDDRAS